MGKCEGQVRYGRKLTACAGKKIHKVRCGKLDLKVLKKN